MRTLAAALCLACRCTVSFLFWTRRTRRGLRRPSTSWRLWPIRQRHLASQFSCQQAPDPCALATAPPSPLAAAEQVALGVRGGSAGARGRAPLVCLFLTHSCWRPWCPSFAPQSAEQVGRKRLDQRGWHYDWSGPGAAIQPASQRGLRCQGPHCHDDACLFWGALMASTLCGERPGRTRPARGGGEQADGDTPHANGAPL